MKRCILIITAFVALMNLCFADSKITVGNISYELTKNTKPVEVFPAARAYKRTSGGHIVNVRFPGYKTYVPVNGSSFYPGWDGVKSSTSGIITVTSPREYIYTFDNGYDSQDPNTAELNKQGTPLRLIDITDPNGELEDIYTYDSSGLITYIHDGDDANSVYMRFDYDANDLLESITAIDPTVSTSSDNYSRTYTIVYDSNDRVVSTTCNGGCGCGGASSDWLTDVYDANSMLIAQKDKNEQTIYSYSYHPDTTLKEKKDKDNNPIIVSEFEELGNGKKTLKLYDYVDPNIYRYTEKLVDIDGSLESETVFEKLRDDRIDPNTYDPNSFITKHLYTDYNGKTKIVIPDGADANGTGVRTEYCYNSDYNLNYENQYDRNNNVRVVVYNSYSGDKLNSTKDIRGATTHYEYVSGAYRIYKQKLPYEGTGFRYYYRYLYDSQNRKIAEEVRLDDTSIYDDANDPLTQTTNFEYDKYGNVCKEYYNGISDRSDANSIVTEYVYNAFGNLIWHISPVGVVTGKTYDSSGRVISEFVLAGGLDDFNQISNPLDCSLSSLDVTSQKTYDYDSVYGKLEELNIAIEDANSFTYNNPNGWATTYYTYDSYGRKETQTQDYGTGRMNLTTAYEYNTQNEIVEVTYPDGHSQQTVRGGRGLTIESIETDGSDSITTSYVFDNRSTLIEVWLNDTTINSYDYDDYGRKITTYQGNTSSDQYTEYTYYEYTYNDIMTDDIETEEVWDIDDSNQAIQIKETFKKYDIFGRVVFRKLLKDPDAGEDGTDDRIFFYQYDILGNLTLTADKGDGNYWDSYSGGYDYSPSGSSYDGDIIELRKYNDNSQLTAVMKFEYPEIGDSYFDSNLPDAEEYILENDPNIHYIKFEYQNSQVTDKSLYTGIDPNTQELTFAEKVSYDYDNAGRVTKTTDADDNYTTVQYNSQSRPIAKTLWQGKHVLRFNDSNGVDPNFVPYPVSRTLTAYNNIGAVTTAAVLVDPNSCETIEDINETADKITDYIYDANGKLYRQKEMLGINPDGDYLYALMEYSYDTFGRVKEVLYGELKDVYFQGAYYDEDKYPLKYIRYHYDANGRKDVQTVTDVNTITWATVDVNIYYEHDDEGRVEKIENEDGVLARYYYDTLGQKIKVIDEFGSVKDFSYDGMGNVTETVEDANSQQRTTEFTYDRNGRRTAITAGNDSTDYTYNYLGKITSIDYPDGKVIDYGHDIEGNVTSRTVTENSNSVTTYYKRNALGRISHKQYSNDPNWTDPNLSLPFDEMLYDAAGNKILIAYVLDSHKFILGGFLGRAVVLTPLLLLLN